MSAKTKSGTRSKSRKKSRFLTEIERSKIVQFVVDNPNLIIKQIAADYGVTVDVIYKLIAARTEMKRTLRIKPTDSGLLPWVPGYRETD